MSYSGISESSWAVIGDALRQHVNSLEVLQIYSNHNLFTRGLNPLANKCEALGYLQESTQLLLVTVCMLDILIDFHAGATDLASTLPSTMAVLSMPLTREDAWDHLPSIV